MNSAALSFAGLTKRFGTVLAVDRVSLTIPSGIVYGFLGPNGAGKTTLLRMLSGMLVPDEGSGLVLGRDVSTEQDQIRHNLGYMSQKVSLYDEITAADNLHFFGSIYGLENGAISERRDELTGRLSLEGLWDRKVSELSKGARQRVAFACAVAHRPALLMLDEPSAGMDPVSRADFWDILYEEAASGTTLIVTTHFMEEAEHCDRLCLMNEGRVIAEGRPSDLRESFAGRIWEIDVERAPEALSALEPYFTIGLHGDRLRAVVAPGQSGKEIAGVLIAAGVTEIDLRPAPATLEEVFVGHLENR